MLTALLIPTLTHQMTALAGWLDKAEAHAATEGSGPDTLFTHRIAPDMFPLATQIRFAAFQAQEPVHLLRGDPLPETLLAVRDEGRHGGERPGTLAEARARVTEALAFLGSVTPGELDSDPDAPFSHALPMGMVFDMTRATYVRDWALPQAAFHQLAAYMILRAAGVPLGKPDYVPHMFAYLRPGTGPSG